MSLIGGGGPAPLLPRAAELRSTQSLFADGFESTTPPASTWQLTYDPFNRLSAITGPGLSAGYKVAATGLRVEKTVNGTTTRFVYGINGQLLHENATTTGRRTHHLYLNGKPIAFVRSNGPGNGNVLYHLHADHLGRPERITDPSNAIVWRARLAAFNHSVTLDQIGGYHLGFPGQYRDTETGFAYNIHRDYDPATGRYLQSDPIGLNGGINTYAYAMNSPVMMIDPLGLRGCPPPPPESGLESVCPECLVLGVGRLAYAGIAKLIPSASWATTGSAMEQGMVAVSMRNSLKDIFRFPLGFAFAGARQPSFNHSMARYGGDLRALIEASARTNPAVNAVGTSGIGIGVASLIQGYEHDDLGVMENYQGPCGCGDNE